MKNFSPNMLKTFEECEKKFYFKYIEKKSLPQKSATFVKGKKIHALANYCLNGFDIKKMLDTLDEEEYNIWCALKENKFFNMETVKTEYNLTCRIKNFWIGGRLDAIVKNDSNYLILDYKTGNIPQNAENDFQTIVYLLCADKLYQKKGGYESLRFVYIGLKKGVEKEIMLDDINKKSFENKIISICEKITNAVTTNHFSETCTNCEHCEYYKICKQI